MDAVRIAVLNEEFYRAGVPRVTRGMGEALVGPSVIVHGTPEQRAYFLPRIISGEDVYCQGFSEPDHGSDLAAVRDARRGRRGRGRHHRPEGLDLGRRPGQPDVPAVPDRPGRGQARRALLRADRLHRPRRPVPADQADVGRGGVLRGLPGRRPGPAVQRHRRPEQRLAGGHDDARARARRPGHRGPPRLRAGVLGAGRDGAQAREDRRPAGPAAARLGLHAGRADAVQRPAHAGPAGGGPPAGPGGLGGQAVLERVPQAAGRDRDRHRGRRTGCCGRTATATRSAPGRACS